MASVLLAFPLAFMLEGNEVQTSLLVFRSGHQTVQAHSFLRLPIIYSNQQLLQQRRLHRLRVRYYLPHLHQPVVGTAASCQIARCSPVSSTSNPSQSTEPEVPTAMATASENERSPIANPSQGALSSRGRTRMTKAQTTKKTQMMIVSQQPCLIFVSLLQKGEQEGQQDPYISIRLVRILKAKEINLFKARQCPLGLMLTQRHKKYTMAAIARGVYKCWEIYYCRHMAAIARGLLAAIAFSVFIT